MGSSIVGILLFAFAGMAMWAWVRGEKDVFKDEFAFGSVLLIVGVLGGAILGALVLALLYSLSWIAKELWVGVVVVFSVWGSWCSLIYRLLSKSAGTEK